MVEALDSEETNELKNARNRLRDLQVPDVDIVDRPANRRRFLIVKKEDGMSEETAGNEFSTGDIDIDLADPESGTAPAAPAAPAADDTGAAAAPATDDAKPENVAKAEEIKKAAAAHAALLQEKLDAIKKIADEISAGAGTMDAKDLKTKIGQLERLGWKVEGVADVVSISKAEGEGGTTDVAKAIPTPVRDAVVKALREASERLMSVNVALRGATVTQDKVSAPLPDPIAREIKAIKTQVGSVLQRYPSPASAGKSEGEGETEPAEVGYETAHEMMKQAAALTLPAPVRDAVSAKVRGATELLQSIIGAVQKMETTEERVSAPLPPETATAIVKAVGILDEIIKQFPAPAAKSDDAISALGQHFDAIKNLVAGLAGGTVVVKEEPKPEENPLLDALMGQVKKNSDLLEKMAKTPGSSNALPDDGKTPVRKDEGAVEWGMDLAAE